MKSGWISYARVYLAAYVLIAYYVRYSLPLLLVFVLATHVGLDGLARAWRKVSDRGRELPLELGAFAR